MEKSHITSLAYFGIEFHSSLVILLLQQFVNSRFEQTTQKSHMLYHLFTLLSIQFVDEIIYIYLLFHDFFSRDKKKCMK